MEQAMQTLFFILSSLILSLLAIRARGTIFIFRALGLILSLAIVFTYNLNWLLHKPVTLLNISAFFIAASLMIVIRRRMKVGTMQKLLDGFRWRSIMVVVLAMTTLFLLGFVYFQQELDLPRYFTPDSGTHFLYMSQTAETGFLPSFLPSKIYPSSGSMKEFEYHHSSYFPGSTVVFLLIDKLFAPRNNTTSLQLFNMFFYSLISIYFISVFQRWRGSIKKLTIFLLFVLIALGTFFDFLVTSFSTQLLGLYFLIFFLDIFSDFILKKEEFSVAAGGLSAIIITYFYWLPVALLFMFFSNIGFYASFLRKNFVFNFDGFMRMIKSIGVGIVSLILSAGYIISALSVNMLSHAADDGGFNLQDQILSAGLFFAPLAILQLFLLLKNRTKKMEKMPVENMSMSVALYGCILMLLFFNHRIVSHYAAMKVLYLLVPIIWLLSLEFATEQLGVIYQSIRDKSTRSSMSIKKLISVVVVPVFLLYGCAWIVSDVEDIAMKPFSLIEKNVDFILNQSKKTIITKDQMRLLDLIKKSHNEAIDEGRLFVIAPADTSLWVFAYSGIWPRTYALLPKGQDANTSLAMSFWSPNIADYQNWLQNDKKHLVVYFDKKVSESWARKNNFNFDDYAVIASVGNNHLLELKNSR